MYGESYYDGVYVQSTPKGTSSGSLKVYISSIMSGISMGTPTIVPYSLNDSLFNNASDCRPSIASTLNTQNYCTALAPYSPYENSLYYYGSAVQVEALSADVLSCRLRTDDVDNSRDL